MAGSGPAINASGKRYRVQTREQTPKVGTNALPFNRYRPETSSHSELRKASQCAHARLIPDRMSHRRRRHRRAGAEVASGGACDVVSLTLGTWHVARGSCGGVASTCHVQQVPRSVRQHPHDAHGWSNGTERNGTERNECQRRGGGSASGGWRECQRERWVRFRRASEKCGSKASCRGRTKNGHAMCGRAGLRPKRLVRVTKIRSVENYGVIRDIRTNPC